MPRSLLISVRFYEGQYHGQEDRFDGSFGWPPSPGRLFQALVAGSACGANLQADDVCALKWLEDLAPPRIAAPAARRGRAVKFYVPNNDLDSAGGDPDRASKTRVDKYWRPCYFDPDEPVLYVWEFESGLTAAARICAIATGLFQLGRGIDMAWANGQVLDRQEADALLASHPGPLRVPGASGETATPHPGTLDSLVNRYQRKRRRLSTKGAGREFRQAFRQPPKVSFRHTGYDTPARHLHFELRGPEGGFAPRYLSSVAPMVTSLRDAAARRLQESLPAKSALFERLIIGRDAGPCDLPQRIRLRPIPSIGAKYTDPSIRRIMVEVPSGCPIRVDDLKWAFAGLQPHDPQTGEAWLGSLASTEDSEMANRYMQPAHVFQSITPVALSGTQRRGGGTSGGTTAEMRSREERRAASMVVQALRHAGIRAKPTDIRVQREPFQMRGVRAENFAKGSRFSPCVLWHVKLRFREAIPGPLPLVIGDGRFHGLGLMEPIVSYNELVAFNLDEKHRVSRADKSALIRYLRRALMSLSRDDSGRVGGLFSGHEADGRSDRAGHHAHVFLAADEGDDDDDSIARLIVAAPWVVDRRAMPQPQGDDRRLFDSTTRQLNELRAGRLGRFTGLVPETIDDGDPLLGPATTWVGKTSYVATRNLKKRDDPGAFIKADVIAECARRGLPRPMEVHVSDCAAGTRGGWPTAKLTICFATAIRGPVLLGRDSHAGGGLFHAAPPRE